MPGCIEKTVFISYRRTNFWTALAIFQNLNANGYDVFFDYKSIPSGDFEQVITENVNSRAHFIVILSPSALNRCNVPGDWLRKEIELAIESKRNIVPLMMEGFDFGSPATVNALTGKLAELKKYNAMGIPVEYFDEALKKLCSDKFLNRPLESVLQPVSEKTKQITEDQKFAANDAAPVEKVELTAQEWFERGYNLYKNQEEKIRCYTEAIRLAPNFWEAYYHRGVTRTEKGDLDGAIQDYAKADRLKSDNIELYKSSIKIRESRRFVEDIEDYRDDDLFKHESARLHWIRGSDRHSEGDLDRAITDYSETIRLKPDFPGIYCLRGMAYRQKGDFDSAITDYDKAIDIEPDDFTAYYGRGILQQVKGELKSALTDFTNTIIIKPDHAMARVSLFGLLKKLGRADEAREHEQIALVLIQKEDKYNRACFDAIRGKTDMALKLLEIWLATAPSDKRLARQDPDFENIRNDPRFTQLVSE